MPTDSSAASKLIASLAKGPEFEVYEALSCEENLAQESYKQEQTVEVMRRERRFRVIDFGRNENATEFNEYTRDRSFMWLRGREEGEINKGLGLEPF